MSGETLGEARQRIDHEWQTIITSARAAGTVRGRIAAWMLQRRLDRYRAKWRRLQAEHLAAVIRETR